MIVRCLFVVSVLAWVVATKEFQPMFSLLICSLIVLKAQGLSMLFFVRSFRLLFWLFIPILLFHGIFTPGTYMQSPIYLPLSVEGLERALFLCTHVALIFYSALLIFRTLTPTEWFAWLNKLPKADTLKPYLLLLPVLRKRMAVIVHEQKENWLSTKQRWLHLPDALVLSIQEMAVAGKEEANDLWNNWEKRMLQNDSEVILLWVSKDILYVVLMVAGWGLMWIL
jgi:hypothetical protein